MDEKTGLINNNAQSVNIEPSIEEGLLYAIKNDSVKAFRALPEKAQSGAHRLGRFPVLSLMYLYKADKLLSVYEDKFLKVTGYEPLREPMEISKKFSSKAGKCLRLYLSETVTPAEMLLIIDKTRHLKSVYPSLRPSNAVKARLKSIYYIKYSLSVKFEGDAIIIDRRPLSYREKKKIVTVCLCAFLALIIVVGVPVTTVSLIPKPVEGEVSLLKQIDFESTKVYTLKKDLVIPEDYSVEKVNCTIVGDGHKLIFGKGASLGELNGKVSGVTVESDGGAIFTSVSPNSSIKDVTVNVNADLTSDEGTGFVAINNYGTIENVTVNVTGKLTARDDEAETTSDLYFGGVVWNNNNKYNSTNQTIYSGKIKNCTVNYSDFELSGELGANASFGGVAGTNNGYLQACSVTGEIAADTFDIAGICSLNNGSISDCISEAEISQTSADTNWNPIVCGIVITNAYSVENCQNKGDLSSVSACGKFDVQDGYESIASASGIAYLNRGSSTSPKIKNCSNSGTVKSSAEYRDSYATGVCLSSNGTVEDCKNTGKIEAVAANGCGAYASGIVAIAYGNVYTAVNEGGIYATGGGVAYAGGIVSRLCAQITECLSKGEVTATAETVYAGGICAYGEIGISYNFYVYVSLSILDSCISECKFDVTATNADGANVGGIVGYLQEEKIISNNTPYYFSGCVTNCYFVGEGAAATSRFGNIVGVCGANTYDNNAFVLGANEYINFDGNIYVSNSFKAFGATVNEDGEFAQVADKGASSASSEEIRNLSGYKAILNALT